MLKFTIENYSLMSIIKETTKLEGFLIYQEIQVCIAILRAILYQTLLRYPENYLLLQVMGYDQNLRKYGALLILADICMSH